jgi:hypothetical protein
MEKLLPDLEQAPEPNDESRTIAASLNSVWNRYAGSAPADSEVELGAGVVRWSFPTALRDELREGIATRTGEDGAPLRTMASFERETAAVVARATRRKIAARFSKKAEDGIATEVFVLEAITRQF